MPKRGKSKRNRSEKVAARKEEDQPYDSRRSSLRHALKQSHVEAVANGLAAEDLSEFDLDESTRDQLQKLRKEVKLRGELEEEDAPIPEPTEVLPSKRRRKTNKEFQFSEDVTLEELRAELQNFTTVRDWDKYHTPRNLALALVREVGEVCGSFQWKTDSSSDERGLPGWSEKEREKLGSDLGDVLLYLLRLSDKCSIDLVSAARQKLLLLDDA